MTRWVLKAIGFFSGRSPPRRWNKFCKIHELKPPSKACRSPVVKQREEWHWSKHSKFELKMSNRSSSSSKLFIMTTWPSREQRLEWLLSSLLLLEHYPAMTWLPCSTCSTVLYFWWLLGIFHNSGNFQLNTVHCIFFFFVFSIWFFFKVSLEVWSLVNLCNQQKSNQIFA